MDIYVACRNPHFLAKVKALSFLFLDSVVVEAESANFKAISHFVNHVRL